MTIFARSKGLWLPAAVPTAAPAALPQPEKPKPATIRMVGNRRMKCSDIPDDVFLDAVRRTPGVNGSTEPDVWRMRWDVQAELEKELGPIPEKLFLAKARRLGQRQLLGGCTQCSCRGDYHIAAECRTYGCCTMERETRP